MPKLKPIKQYQYILFEEAVGQTDAEEWCDRARLLHKGLRFGAAIIGCHFHAFAVFGSFSLKAYFVRLLQFTPLNFGEKPILAVSNFGEKPILAVSNFREKPILR